MALITCSECGKKYSSLAKACPECACPVTEKDLIEKIEKLVFEIPDGTIEIIGQYEQQILHLNKECDNLAAKLEQLIKPLSSSQAPQLNSYWEVNNECHRRGKEFQQYCQNFEYFITEALLSPLQSLSLIFCRNMLPFPEAQVRQLFTAMKTEHGEVVQHTYNAIDDAIHKINNIPVPVSRPVVVAASWVAIAMNDFNAAADRAERNNYEANVSYHRGCISGKQQFYQNESYECGKKFIHSMLDTIKTTFASQALRIHGEAAEKRQWNEWRSAVTEPFSYLPIIREYNNIEFLKPLLQHFNISDATLISAIVDTVSAQIASPSNFEIILQQEDSFIDKVCILVNQKKDVIIQNIARSTFHLFDSQIVQLTTTYRPTLAHLDNTVTTAEIVNQNVSVNALYAYANVLGSELFSNISSYLNQSVSSVDEVMQVLSNYVDTKCSEVRQVRIELEQKLEVLEKNISELQSELAQCSVFNLLKKRNLQKKIEDLQYKQRTTRHQFDELLQ